MFNLDNITEKYYNKDWPYRKFIIGPSGGGKTNYLLNSIQRDPNIIDKIYIYIYIYYILYLYLYLYAKDLEEPKYKLLIKENKLESILMMILLLLLSILILWMTFYRVLNNIKKRRKILIIFDDMMSDVFHVISYKKALQVLKEYKIH